MNDPAWQNVPVITGFTQVLPVDGREPIGRITLRVAFSADGLAIAARRFDDDPTAIASRPRRRDADTSSNLFLRVDRGDTIPFCKLRCFTDAPQSWGINVSRQLHHRANHRMS